MPWFWWGDASSRSPFSVHTHTHKTNFSVSKRSVARLSEWECNQLLASKRQSYGMRRYRVTRRSATGGARPPGSPAVGALRGAPPVGFSDGWISRCISRVGGPGQVVRASDPLVVSAAQTAAVGRRKRVPPDPEDHHVWVSWLDYPTHTCLGLQTGYPDRMVLVQ